MQVICLYKGLCKNPKIFNTLSGLPYGQEKSGNQEKSGKTKKNDKSQVKMGGFWKKSGKKIKKPQILSVQIYLIPFN